MPQKVRDPDYLEVLRTPGSIERARYPEFLALDLWEQIGTYCKHHLIDEKILLDITSSQVLKAWRDAEPAIRIVRERAGPSGFENFEYLAMRAALWNRRHPHGTYPARLGRMPHAPLDEARDHKAWDDTA